MVKRKQDDDHDLDNEFSLKPKRPKRDQSNRPKRDQSNRPKQERDQTNRPKRDQSNRPKRDQTNRRKQVKTGVTLNKTQQIEDAIAESGLCKEMCEDALK